MDRATFEAELLREDYDVRELHMPPDQTREPHTHEFDAKLFILDGVFSLVRDGVTETFRPGQICSVPAGTLHQEKTGAEGAHYLAGRRMPAQSTVGG
jgi:mannose-6-phosphate isomerase-like protein (cupin superfamily)